MTIRIVTDSACDIPQALVEKYNITIVPLTFSFGDKEFIDRVSLTTEEFWKHCADSPILPQTAAPAPGQFTQAYRTLIQQGASGILVISLSRELSATMQSAETGAKEPGVTVPVRFVDSRSASMGEGITVIAVAKMVAAGASLDELEAAANNFASRTKVFGALDTLENLKKGGRISNTKAFLASALAIKPIIEVREGKLEEGGKERTRGKALAFLIEKIKSAGEISDLAVLHAQCSDIDSFVAQLKTIHSGEIIVSDIGSVIGSHTGIGTIGVTYHVK
jgi:DegV family protein with EDD domain